MKRSCVMLLAVLLVGCSTAIIPNPVANRVPNEMPIQDIQATILFALEGSNKTISKNASGTSQRFRDSLTDSLEPNSGWSVEAIAPNGIRSATYRNTQ